MLSWERASIEDRFGHGECHAFTWAALAQVPTARARVLEHEGPGVFDEREIVHSVAWVSAQRVFDAYGWRTAADVKRTFAFLPGALEWRDASAAEIRQLVGRKGVRDAQHAVQRMLGRLP